MSDINLSFTNTQIKNLPEAEQQRLASTLGMTVPELLNQKVLTVSQAKSGEVLSKFSAFFEGSSKPTLEAPSVSSRSYTLDDLNNLITLLTGKSRESMASSSKASLNIEADRMKSAHEEKMENLMKQIDKAKKAEAMGMSSVALQWVGFAFAAIAGGLIAAATGGAAAGLIIAGLAMMAVTTVDATINAGTEAATGEAKGLFQQIGVGIEKLALLSGESKEKAKEIGKWASFAIQMGVTIVGAALQGAGAVSAAKQLVTSILSQVMDKVNMAQKVGSGVTGVVSGVTGMTTGTFEIQAAKFAKKSSDAAAAMKEIEAIQQELMKILQLIMQASSNAVSAGADVINTMGDNALRAASGRTSNA